jgi:deazaflavin-dependent oxidoreductase (nitroreductase family)
MSVPRETAPPRRRQPFGRRARVRLNHAHAWIYARSGGRVGGRVGPSPVLLLTTTGRRSGRPRRTPVQYQRIDGALMIVAAAGGAPEPPAWWRNVEADPRVTVQIRAERWPARAVPARGARRDELWRRLCEANRYLPRVAQRAGRELPVIEIEPGRPPA